MVRKPAPSSGRKTASGDSESLSLPFDEPERKPPPPVPPASPPVRTFEEELPAPIAADEPEDIEESEPLDDPAMAEDEFEITEIDDEYTLGSARPESVARTGAGARSKKGSGGSRKAAKSAPRVTEETNQERGKIRAILFFLFLTVLSYGVLAGALLSDPDMSDRFVRGLPLIGNALGGDRHMYRKIALSDVKGAYQRIRDGKGIFVITGRALNTAPVGLQSVQIVGRLFDDFGKELDKKVIYCGNTISAKVLRDLTPRELSILQQVNPPRHFIIEPGESSTFVIVFLEPPKGTADFSVQVVAAQRQA